MMQDCSDSVVYDDTMLQRISSHEIVAIIVLK